MLEIKNLNFSYDSKKKILKNINYKFELGTFYGIHGKSGAGKTTLLSLLAGLEKTKDGDILFDGKDIDHVSREVYRSKNVGIIFQQYNLLPHYTALENVLLSADISGKKIKAEDGLKLLESVGIDRIKAKRRVLLLSGGEQQRVSIARALAIDSKLILADEPTGNLDTENETEIINILKNLAHKSNKCVIVVSHSDTVKASVDTLLYLEKGNLTTSLPRK